ncbi:telomere-protecting terminal protein Tpg, partial [Streptomyces phaeochromogenes]
MGIFEDSLDKAAANTATRPIPKSAGAQVRFLVKQVKNSTRAAAQLLGVSQRTVERYLKGQIKHPRPELAARLEAEVRKRWQPRVRDRAKKQAATSTGI